MERMNCSTAAAVRQGISDAYDGSVTLKNAASYAGFQATLKEKGLDLDLSLIHI